MKCPACKKGKLHKGEKTEIYTYKGKSIELNQLGMWCDSCEEGIISGDEIAVTEQKFENFKMKVDGLLKPEEIRHIRKDILGLTQKKAAEIFGGGKNAFSRYERGEIKPNLAVNNLLKMFERHPEDIKYWATG